MSLQTQAVITDVVSEFGASGSTTPFTLFNFGGVTSGQIYDKITEANAALQGWTGVGGSASPNALQKEQIKRFEVVYAAARLAADLIGIVITDGFNYSEGGISIQRQSAEFNTYKQFVADHLMIAKEYIKMLHPWFVVYNSSQPEGLTNMGTAVTYWRTQPAWEG